MCSPFTAALHCADRSVGFDWYDTVASMWYGYRFTRFGACVHNSHFTMASTSGQGETSTYGYMSIDAMWITADGMDDDWYSLSDYWSLQGTTYANENCILETHNWKHKDTGRVKVSSEQWTNVYVPTYKSHFGSMAKRYMTGFSLWV